jgi:hypothetical protein
LTFAAYFRSVARAVHENAKAAAAKKAAPVGASPITSRTRSKQSNGNQKQDISASKIKDKVSHKKKIEDKEEDPSSDDIPDTEVKDDDESEDGDVSGEDEFTSQRLVVRLTPKQEKKLEEGLKKIKKNAAAEPPPQVDEPKSTKRGMKTVSKCISFETGYIDIAFSSSWSRPCTRTKKFCDLSRSYPVWLL